MTLVFFFSPVAAKQRERRGKEERNYYKCKRTQHGTWPMAIEHSSYTRSTTLSAQKIHQNSCYLEHSIISHTHKQAMAPHLARWSHTSGHSSRTVPHLEGRSQIWPRHRETSSTVLRLSPWSPYVKKDTVNELNLNATHAVPSVYLCTQPCARSSLIVPYRIWTYFLGGAWRPLALPPAPPARPG